jgi:tRNA(Ile)-lysidine synthase
VRLRQSGAVLGQIGLSSGALVRTAKRAARAADALEAMTDRFAADVVDLNGGAYAAVRWRKFAQAQSEIAIRLLRRLVTAFGGQGEACRLSRVESVYDALLAKQKGVTLGGCIVDIVGGTMRVMREPERAALEHVAMGPGPAVLWDHRFAVQPARAPAAPATIRPIGRDGLAEIKARLGGGTKFALPRQVLLGLPSIWQGEALVALPAIRGIAPELTSGYDTFPALFLNEGMVMSGNSMPIAWRITPA